MPYYSGGYATCVCGKILYKSRKDAKRLARYRHPGKKGLSAYYCPYGNGWHYGHLPPGGHEQARRAMEAKRKRNEDEHRGPERAKDVPG